MEETHTKARRHEESEKRKMKSEKLRYCFAMMILKKDIATENTENTEKKKKADRDEGTPREEK